MKHHPAHTSGTHRFLFDETNVVNTLKHYLPSQGPIKDFIHHNPLHVFENEAFYTAIFHASQIFGYNVTFTLTEYRNLYKSHRINPEVVERVLREHKGNRLWKSWQEKLMVKTYDWVIEPRVGKLRHEWKRFYDIELDNAVHPLLFRIIGSYLDQGISVTQFPLENNGLLHAIRNLESMSASSFFKTKHARELLLNTEVTITELVSMLVGEESYFAQYLYDQQFAHPGWSGMVSAVEDHPNTLLYAKNITLQELIHLELLFEIDALTYRFGNSWKPLGKLTSLPPTDIFASVQTSELQEVIRLWHEAFEWSYYDTVLHAFRTVLAEPASKNEKSSPHFQAIFCIDEREYSLRTYLEQTDRRCETYGAPGFFGVAFYFHPAHAKFYDKLAPAPVTPLHLIEEITPEPPHKHDKEIMFAKASHTLIRGYLYSYLLGIPALGKLCLNLFSPSMSPAIADSFSHMNPNSKLTIRYNGRTDASNGLRIGFTPLEMADRVEGLLRMIGLTEKFAPLIYIVGHGSSSANNPHHGAHDCGACSGRPGLVNARVFAMMANDPSVREILKTRSITISDETQFIGASHDTASDEIRFFDENILSQANALHHKRNIQNFDRALDLNAKERSRRFISINTKSDRKTIRADIKKRSVSYFEPRPELGHGTNALCIVGRRSITQRLFLDRRAFLQSYDYSQDPDGTILFSILSALTTVCGGINLEYFFSRMDNVNLGAGTKLPHNVVGLIGVTNSCDGDLRLGLPLQMIEVHDPIRLLMIVEHKKEIVKKVISSNQALNHWFINQWIHLVTIDPETKALTRFTSGDFLPYIPVASPVRQTAQITEIIEAAPLMKTNHIVDATKEHIPVHILQS